MGRGQETVGIGEWGACRRPHFRAWSSLSEQQEALEGLSWRVTSCPGFLREILLAQDLDALRKETLDGWAKVGDMRVWPQRTKTYKEVVTVGIVRRVCTVETALSIPEEADSLEGLKAQYSGRKT